jgi:hypothetical protein
MVSKVSHSFGSAGASPSRLSATRTIELLLRLLGFLVIWLVSTVENRIHAQIPSGAL